MPILDRKAMQKQKTRGLLYCVFCVFMLNLGAYDVRTPALVPVDFQPVPEHAGLRIIDQGKPQLVIVYDRQLEAAMSKTNKTEKSIEPAVAFLQEAFLQCTGIAPEAIDVSEAGRHPLLIVVGDCLIARENGVDVRQLPVQGLQVKTFARGIILAGHDSSLIEGYNLRPLEKRGSSTGTKYAVYDFVERFLGARFFFPGKFGTYWPKIDALTIAPVHYKDQPFFDTRNGIYYIGDSIRSPESKKFWEPYLGELSRADQFFYDRWRMGGTIPVGGSHCPRPERMALAYPDQLKTIFYTSPTGNFWYNSKQHIGNYYDVVNLEFADLLFSSMKKYYDSDGRLDEGGFNDLNRTYASFGMCDTLMPDTDVIHHPLVQKLGLMTPADLARGANSGMANIYARFHQHLARRMQQELPGISLYIMAYYNAQYAGNDPRWQLPPNTEVNLCLGDLPTKTRNAALMQKNVQMAKEWYDSLGGRAVQKLWLYDTRDNAFIKAVAGEFVGDVPKIFGEYIGRTSLFYDHNSNAPGNIWFYYPSAYCAYRSMWNPAWDAEAGIEEHWALFYGVETGRLLSQFHRLVKDCFLKYYVPSPDKTPPVYPLAEVEKLEQLLAAAEKAVAAGSSEARQRFKLYSAPWPKALQAMKNQISYERQVYPVYRLLQQETVVIDGKGEEPFWSKVKEMELIDPKGTSDKPRFPVRVRLAWDSSGLYGLLKTSYPVKAEKNLDLWGNDSFELFFSPGMKQEVEYQFAFDALKNLFLGTQRHLPIPQPYDSHWKAPGFRLESVLDAQSWEAEFFIPFSVFAAEAPKPYELWFCNIVRNKLGEPREYSGNSMTLGNNHNLPMYALLKFSGRGD